MKNKYRVSEEDDDMDFNCKPFYVSHLKGGEGDGGDLYNIYIFGPILDAEQFIPAIEALQMATEDDHIIVNLSTPGGSSNATDTFLQMLKLTEATVVFVASGGVHSAGTMILMHADASQIAFSNGFYALVHNGSLGGGDNKYSDWVKAADFSKFQMEKLMRESYKGFLSEAEIQDLLHGRDFWFEAEEFKTRLQNRNTLLSKN